MGGAVAFAPNVRVVVSVVAVGAAGPSEALSLFLRRGGFCSGLRSSRPFFFLFIGGEPTSPVGGGGGGCVGGTAEEVTGGAVSSDKPGIPFMFLAIPFKLIKIE